MSRDWNEAVSSGFAYSVIFLVIMLANYLLTFCPWWLIYLIGLAVEKAYRSSNLQDE